MRQRICSVLEPPAADTPIADPPVIVRRFGAVSWQTSQEWCPVDADEVVRMVQRPVPYVTCGNFAL